MGDGPNTYAYVGNNPLAYIDRNGLSRSNVVGQGLKDLLGGGAAASSGFGGTGGSSGFNHADPLGIGFSSSGSSASSNLPSSNIIPPVFAICVVTPVVCDILLSGDDSNSDNVIPFPGTQETSGDICPVDNEGYDGNCKKRQRSLEVQKDILLAGGFAGITADPDKLPNAIKKFNMRVSEHNQNCPNYRVEPIGGILR